MHNKTTLYKLFIFIFVFTGVFFIIKYFHIFPSLSSQNNLASIPWLFSAIALIFSVISGFIIQSKWHTWDNLIAATQGELSAFRQLHIMAYHFSGKIRITIRQQICYYLEIFIHESKEQQDVGMRSTQMESALYDLEETIFNARKESSESSILAFDIIRNCMKYREQRLQNSGHQMPLGIRIFTIIATASVIFASLFIGVQMIVYSYIFTLLIGILSYGIYIIIDDLDHPYRLGAWHLNAHEYEELFEEIKKECGYTNRIHLQD